MSFIAFKNNVSHGWVRVKWAVSNVVGEYRLGAEGAVEVVASKTVNGGTIYADHLPVVGEYGKKSKKKNSDTWIKVVVITLKLEQCGFTIQ